MQCLRIFIDFGSTFTKVVAFDLEKEELIARVQAPSSVDTDIMIGLRAALDLLRETVEVRDDDIGQALACSSAAGGLRMICIGLVPEYTTEAGRLAALGAGAKVVGTYSYELSRRETEEIAASRPDIVLLTGGTDGGNKTNIIHNARMLASVGDSVKNIIVAGNKSAEDEVYGIFAEAGKDVLITKNVMPEFGELELEPVNDKIRDVFIRHITEAKGIAGARRMISDVLMPTPSAVLDAAKLISDGAENEPGLGELLLVDVGGATTDVYSIATGAPTNNAVAMIGLPEPYAKRTVEGDIGLFHNLDTLAELAAGEFAAHGGSGAEVRNRIQSLRDVRSVPIGEEQKHDQLLLSRKAVKTAVDRHAGRLERRVTHNGEIWFQRGKDLSKLGIVLGGGGPLAFSSDPRFVLEGAVLERENSAVLKPRAPAFLLDEKYILFAAGLLAKSQPVKALRIMKKYLSKI
ncbi:MAG: methylaspartate mutase accessory protein GlmL [Oscillospiraceae bacterium]|nr:methylaspartate mutase accessory protein GlmL [Oscillospiraceae bacterium]